MENLKNHKAGWPVPLFYGIPSTGKLLRPLDIIDFLKHCVTPKKVKGISTSKKDVSLLHLFPKMATKIHAYIFAICDVIPAFVV